MFSFIHAVLRCNPLIAPPNGRLDPPNCGNLFGAKCGVECLNGYEKEHSSSPRECEKTEDDLAYWTGEETNCTGKHPVDMVELIIVITTFKLLFIGKIR